MICHTVFFLLIIHVFFVFFLTVSISYPLHQNVLFPYLYFKFTFLTKIIRELFPFKYPTISDNTVFWGSIPMRICIMSCPYHLFFLHHCLSIFSAFIFPYSICLLYFGTNTIDIYIPNLYVLNDFYKKSPMFCLEDPK